MLGTFGSVRQSLKQFESLGEVSDSFLIRAAAQRILSRLLPIHPEAVEVGRHGLVISLGARRGLLLPQVAVEHSWDRETFLEQTSRKAGLPLDAWRKAATVEAFTAEVFADADAEVPC